MSGLKVQISIIKTTKIVYLIITQTPLSHNQPNFHFGQAVKKFPRQIQDLLILFTPTCIMNPKRKHPGGLVAMTKVITIRTIRTLSHSSSAKIGPNLYPLQVFNTTRLKSESSVETVHLHQVHQRYMVHISSSTQRNANSLLNQNMKFLSHKHSSNQ